MPEINYFHVGISTELILPLLWRFFPALLFRDEYALLLDALILLLVFYELLPLFLNGFLLVFCALLLLFLFLLIKKI